MPITILLRDQLVEHKMATGREGDQLLFGRTSADASNGKVMQDRADDAWAKAGLNRITPHQCRHTFASLMIAAGVDAKALSTYMGHANIAVTLDLYGHLMPGSEAEAAGLLDTYLAAQLNTATEAGRGAGEVLTGAPAGARARETAYLSG